MRLTILFLAMLGLAACETVQGAGRDIQSGGAVVEDGAQDVQREMQR